MAVSVRDTPKRIKNDNNAFITVVGNRNKGTSRAE